MIAHDDQGRNTPRQSSKQTHALNEAKEAWPDASRQDGISTVIDCLMNECNAESHICLRLLFALAFFPTAPWDTRIGIRHDALLNPHSPRLNVTQVVALQRPRAEPSVGRRKT